MKMNPIKCAFGVSSGECLGLVVKNQGPKIDPAKIKAILRMPVLETQRQLSSFLGQLAYIGRFIVNLSGKSKPFSKLIKKGAPYTGGNDCQKSFEEIKRNLILRQYWLLQPMAGYSSSTQQLSSRSLGASLMPEQ